MEFRGVDDCKLYGKNGELLADVKPDGAVPVLAPGQNQVTFTCEGPTEPNPRARVTLITFGGSI